MPEGKPKREQPWAVRGVSMEARSAAGIAARKSGQSLGAWLDRVVRDAATETIKGTTRQEVTAPEDPTKEDAVRQLAREMVEMKNSLATIGSSLETVIDRTKPQPGFFAQLPAALGLGRGKK